MVNYSIICCSDKVRMRAKTADHKVRILTLKGMRLYGQLEGADFNYFGGCCERWLMDVLSFEQRATTLFRWVENVNAIIDVNTGLVTVYYDIDGKTYYFLGEGIEYEVIEE